MRSDDDSDKHSNSRKRSVRRVQQFAPSAPPLIPTAPRLLKQHSEGAKWSAHATFRDVVYRDPVSGATFRSKCISLPNRKYVDRSKENEHYTRAQGQYILLDKTPDTVIRVDVYINNTFVEDRYRKRRNGCQNLTTQRFKTGAWVYVFFSLSRITSILRFFYVQVSRHNGCEEFGSYHDSRFFDRWCGNHRVVNGTAHGKGVYTATGPKTPMSYAKTQKL